MKMKSSTKLLIVIADDEAPARRKLRRFLDRIDFEGEILEASTGLEAVELIQAERPELVFLDVQMPKLDGFEVIEEVTPEKMPLTIFTTAYQEYAVRAFEVHALDYLLKPYDFSRFERAFLRATRRKEEGRDAVAKLRTLVENLEKESDEFLQRIPVKKSGRILLVPIDEVAWISSEDKYVRLHTSRGEHLIRGSLSHLEDRLDPNRFKRIHRSHLVNLEFIREIRPWSHGDYVVVMKDGSELSMSRRYSDRLLSKL